LTNPTAFTNAIRPSPASNFLFLLHQRVSNIGTMASALVMQMMALSEPLTIQEALSGVFGSISLATWIFLLVRVLIP
jgi:hypothetical protein